MTVGLLQHAAAVMKKATPSTDAFMGRDLIQAAKCKPVKLWQVHNLDSVAAPAQLPLEHQRLASCTLAVYRARVGMQSRWWLSAREHAVLAIDSFTMLRDLTSILKWSNSDNKPGAGSACACTCLQMSRHC